MESVQQNFLQVDVKMPGDKGHPWRTPTVVEKKSLPALRQCQKLSILQLSALVIHTKPSSTLNVHSTFHIPSCNTLRPSWSWHSYGRNACHAASAFRRGPNCWRSVQQCSCRPRTWPISLLESPPCPRSRFSLLPSCLHNSCVWPSFLRSQSPHGSSAVTKVENLLHKLGLFLHLGTLK